MPVTTGPGQFFVNSVLNAILRGTTFTPPSTLSLRLMSTATTWTALGTQLTGTNYADKVITLNATNFSTPTTGTTTILTDQLFAANTVSWSSPIASMALIDGSANIWWFWNFSPTKTVTDNDTVDFPASSLSLSLATSTGPVAGMGQFAMNAVLKLFQGTALAAPAALNWRLCTTASTATAAGTQMTGTSYVDEALNPATASYSLASVGTSVNTPAVTWTTGAAGDWATPIVSIVIVDGSANIYFLYNLPTSKPVQSGDTVDVQAGAATFSIVDVTA